MTANEILRAQFKGQPNFMTPYYLESGALGEHAAYEISTGVGFEGEPIWGVSIVTEDNGETSTSPLSGLEWSLKDARERVEAARVALRG